MKKLIIYSIILCLLTSCAIHNTFPFICFRKGCIKNQWHLRELKASLKLAKGEANKRKQIREAKNRKRNPEQVNIAQEDYTFEENEEEYKTKTDSVLTFSIKAGQSSLDTIIIVNYQPGQESIPEKDSLFIEQYVERHQTHMFEVVVVQESVFPNLGRKTDRRKEKMVAYLEKLGIKKRIISSQRRNHLYDKESSERIELRIRLKT